MPDNNNQDPMLRNNSIKPWIDLLFRPRQAIREILEKETAQSAWNLWVANTIVLAVVAPIIAYLQTALWGAPIIHLKEWMLGTLVLVIINLLMFYFESYFFWKTSLWFGGHCEKSQMKVVLVWSTVIPVLVFSLIDTILSLLFGKDSLLLLIASNIGFIWSAVIAIACIRELTNLPIWKAGIVWISPYLIILGGMLCIMAIVLMVIVLMALIK